MSNANLNLGTKNANYCVAETKQITMYEFSVTGAHEHFNLFSSSFVDDVVRRIVFINSIIVH